MNNEEVAQELVENIIEVQDYLDNLFYWLRNCTEIDSKEYKEGMDKVEELLEKIHLFDPSKNQSEHPKIILSDSEGNVLGTSESTKDTKKDAWYPSITMYDAENNNIGRCDSITGDATSGVYNILYLRGVDFHKNKNIDDLKKVEVTISSAGSESYLVLTSMKITGSDNSFRCTTLSLNGGVED